MDSDQFGRNTLAGLDRPTRRTAIVKCNKNTSSNSWPYIADCDADSSKRQKIVVPLQLLDVARRID